MMENTNKQIILDSIGTIYEQSKNCKFIDPFFSKVDKELKTLVAYFGVTDSQAFFIAVSFVLNYKEIIINFNSFIEYLECNPINLLQYSSDFDYLIAIGVFKRTRSRYGEPSGRNYAFLLNDIVVDAVLNDQPMPELMEDKIDHVVDFLENISDLGKKREAEELETYELFAEMRLTIALNCHFPLVKRIYGCEYSDEDTFLYLFLVWKTISGRESINLAESMDIIYGNQAKKINYMQTFLSEDNLLIKDKMVEIVEATFFNDTEIKLSIASHTILTECGLQLFQSTKKSDNVLSPAEIKYKHLVYGEQEMKQLSLLTQLLETGKFQETQRKLLEKGLSKGITILIYGAPGTGKTEFVKQLAKETNREIVKVDISQSKSKWFGESEKIIKRIFTTYKAISAESKQTPILFFNEADAIISKRKENGNSNVAQTENTLQNIILEELENFEGILFATTNLQNNFDAAFERRFLFKVQFNKPGNAIRAEIWKSKIPELLTEESEALAEMFPFSGGQIENIARKKAIHEIVHGYTPDFRELYAFCSEEQLEQKRIPIGFIKNN